MLDQWEPGELRGSRRVLRAAEGEVPSADSTLVWTTKYRYQILGDEVGHRCRELLREIAMSKEMIVYAGSINRDHVHSVPRSGGIQEGEATCCM